jgi:hypothetical protein
MPLAWLTSSAMPSHSFIAAIADARKFGDLTQPTAC